jgi:periplasmic copper chaperone A
LVLQAGMVHAHVNAKPSKVTAGSAASVALQIKHGCAGSPTVKVTVKAPATVKKLAAKAPAGWKSSVAGQVVTFEGGTLVDKKLGAFVVSFVAPSTPGTLAFPTIQTCVKGSTSWIQAPNADGSEPDNPAPQVTVTAKA